MSRIKVSKRTSANQGARRKEWPAVIYFWIFGLAILSYLIARVGLNAYPHPYHWLSGLGGGLAGIPIGWLWYRWHGDVF